MLKRSGACVVIRAALRTVQFTAMGICLAGVLLMLSFLSEDGWLYVLNRR